MAEKKKTERFTRTEVPTNYEAAILDNETGENIAPEDIFVEILNRLDEIQKSVG